MEMPGFLYGFYERRLLRSLGPDRIPRHIGVMVDGNRRNQNLLRTSGGDGRRFGWLLSGVSDSRLEQLEVGIDLWSDPVLAVTGRR